MEFFNPTPTASHIAISAARLLGNHCLVPRLQVVFICAAAVELSIMD